MHNDELTALWQIISDYYQDKMKKHAYTTWIKNAKPVALTNNTLIVDVPTRLHVDYWQSNLYDEIAELLADIMDIKVSVIAKLPGTKIPVQAEANSLTRGDTRRKADHGYTAEAQLNSKYTFDNFIVGKGNQLAHAAALAVSEEPGTFYNPLFFYGGVGLGKTHLMQAIGHQVLQNTPNAKVKYVTSETFANDFINSIQNHRQEEFRQEYRSVDLLLVDDIQFFADKDGTQEEFFHTFNALYDNKKQIVLTSDRLPNEIPKLQARLVSRFKWGLSVDITPPDFETRIAILKNKAEAEQLRIPDDSYSYIAGQIDSNIRELEGALMRVKAYASMMHRPVSTSLAADALKDLNLNGNTSELTIPLIQNKVAKYYHITIADLKGKKRVKQIVVPRQIAMYLSRELTDASLPKIGDEFGGKDHTTVIHAHEKIANQLDTDAELQREIADLKAELQD